MSFLCYDSCKKDTEIEGLEDLHFMFVDLEKNIRRSPNGRTLLVYGDKGIPEKYI